MLTDIIGMRASPTLKALVVEGEVVRLVIIWHSKIRETAFLAGAWWQHPQYLCPAEKESPIMGIISLGKKDSDHTETGIGGGQGLDHGKIEAVVAPLVDETIVHDLREHRNAVRVLREVKNTSREKDRERGREEGLVVDPESGRGTEVGHGKEKGGEVSHGKEKGEVEVVSGIAIVSSESGLLASFPTP
jgi:hypothetical protein